jgi:hypothetical protein
MAFTHPSGWRAPTGNALKSSAASARVGGLAVRFSGPDERDLDNEYFTSQTDFGPRNGDGSPVMIHHGNPISVGLEAFAKVILPAAQVQRDTSGLFASTNLDLADPVQRAIYELIQRGAFRWSSGATPQLVQRASDGRLERWFPAEFSLTPTPAEPRLPRIRPL